jgi:cytosine deaminase
MDILIKNAVLPGYEGTQDLAVDGGKIENITPHIEAVADRTIDAGKHVLIPGLIDSHIHLEKGYVMDRAVNKSGTLKEAIQVTGKLKLTFTKEDITERAERALKALSVHGTTCLRTHSEFDPEQGFVGFETTMELKEKYRDIMDIQVVAFPQEGIFNVRVRRK